jgi:enoyl reductase-like protein
MTDQPSTGSTNAAAPTPMQARAEARMLRSEIGNKWGKFTTQELDDLKDNDELVAALVAKYGLDKAAATRDAAAVVQGRAF